MIQLIKDYLFWRKYRKWAVTHKFDGVPMSEEMYCIAPKSFKITRENLRNMKEVVRNEKRKHSSSNFYNIIYRGVLIFNIFF